MPDNDSTSKELLERIRDIQEDIKGVPERGIDGIIPKLQQLEQRQKEQKKRIEDLEGFINTIQSLPAGGKKALKFLAILAGFVLSVIGIWKYFHGH